MLSALQLFNELKTIDGLTNEELAQQLKIDSQQINSWETNKNPQQFDLEAIKQLLNTPKFYSYFSQSYPNLTRCFQWLSNQGTHQILDIFEETVGLGGAFMLGEKKYQTPNGVVSILFHNIYGSASYLVDDDGNPFDAEVDEEERVLDSEWVETNIQPLIDGLDVPSYAEFYPEKNWHKEGGFTTSAFFRSLPKDVQSDIKTQLIRLLNYQWYRSYHQYFGFLDENECLQLFEDVAC